MELTAEEARVLGSLVEKQLTTPQQYPLTLNAVIGACNQSTNRDPVVSYDEDTVRHALTQLAGYDLARAVYRAGSRTAKYRHLLDEYFDLEVAGTAVLCVLLLRGPQTAGELRSRTERMHRFDSTAAIEQLLAELAAHPYQPLTAEMPRRPGQSQARHTQLLTGPPGTEDLAPPGSSGGNRLAELAEQMQELRAELDALVHRVDELERRD